MIIPRPHGKYPPLPCDHSREQRSHLSIFLSLGTLALSRAVLRSDSHTISTSRCFSLCYDTYRSFVLFRHSSPRGRHVAAEVYHKHCIFGLHLPSNDISDTWHPTRRIRESGIEASVRACVCAWIPTHININMRIYIHILKYSYMYVYSTSCCIHRADLSTSSFCILSSQPATCFNPFNNIDYPTENIRNPPHT